MRLIRRKCYNLLYHNKYTLSMGIIKYFIDMTSLTLLNYAGSIYLNLAERINDVRNEYNKTLEIMNSKIRTLSIMERCNFNGFQTFESFKLRLNAKSFSRILVLNKNNSMKSWNKRIMKEIRKWQKNKGIRPLKDDWNDIYRKFPKKVKYDLLWIWYHDAVRIKTMDSAMYYKGNYVERREYPYIPDEIPKCIQFIPFEQKWMDNMMKKGIIYFVVDGSVYFHDKDPKSHIYGYGGCALSIYYNNNKIDEILLPKSIRTHINVMELYILYATFKWMNNKNNYDIIHHADGAVIISDSQNCLKILSQENISNDDILISIYKDIVEEMNKLKDLNLNDKFIKIYWVESHEESKINNDVDLKAKEAAKMVKEKHNLDDDEKDWLAPNSLISYNTIKAEIKYKADRYDAELWYQFKLEKINKFGEHYWKWNIPWNPKKYAEVIPFLNRLENDIRIMLMTGSLPVNVYMVYKANNFNYEPWCEHWECNNGNIQTQESIEHILFDCPDIRYKKQREIMIRRIKKEYDDFDNLIIDEKKKLNFCEKRNDEKYVKQFIFPSFRLKIEQRVKIIKSICCYIKNTRYDLIKRYKEGNCIKNNNDKHIFKYGNNENVD